MLTAPFRLGRFFAQDGSVNYVQDDAERIDGRGAKKTARVLSSTRRRGADLQVLYACCLCVCVVLLSVGPTALPGFEVMAAVGFVSP